MKVYKIGIKAVFIGTVEVRAESAAEAKKIVDQGFGGIMAEVGNSSHLSNREEDDGIVNWDIEIHPDEVKLKFGSFKSK